MKNVIVAGMILAILTGNTVFGQGMPKPATEKKMMNMEFTQEERKNMAEMHDKMALCLRSAKSVNDCHTEMKTSCKQAMGDNCPMMRMIGDRKMMMDHDMMNKTEKKIKK